MLCCLNNNNNNTNNNNNQGGQFCLRILMSFIAMLAAERESILHEGYLYFKEKAFLSKRWNKVYVVLCGKSCNGNDRLEIYHNEDDVQLGKMICLIPLAECVAIQLIKNDEKFAASILTVYLIKNKLEFTCTHDGNLEYWRNTMCYVAFKDANLDNSLLVNQNILKSEKYGFTKEILQALNGKEAFQVQLCHSTSSNHQPGKYLLFVENDSLCLFLQDMTIHLELFPCRQLAWLADGECCFAFQLQNGHILEFSSDKSEKIMNKIQTWFSVVAIDGSSAKLLLQMVYKCFYKLAPPLPTSIDYSSEQRVATSKNVKLKNAEKSFTAVEQAAELRGNCSQLQSNGFAQPTPLKWSKQQEANRIDKQPMQSCLNEQWKFENLQKCSKNYPPKQDYNRISKMQSNTVHDAHPKLDHKHATPRQTCDIKITDV
ncbi:Docking protein [Trichinella pseudospiralis]